MADYTIRKIKARTILDSRGNPTIEVDVFTKTHMGRAAVPSGASTGIHEALELRDKGKAFLGQGVSKAVDNVNTKIARKLSGMDVRQQKQLDNTMIKLDGTPNKAKLGANAILGVSLACARASALVQDKPLYTVLGGANRLPRPFFNVINGGKHADNKLQFQEFMISPKGKTFADSVRMGVETYHELKSIIGKEYGKDSTNVGDEGGFAPNLDSVHSALDLLTEAVEELGYQKKIKFAMDSASSEFFKNGKYFVDEKWLSNGQLSDLFLELAKSYPIISIEDPFDQDDYEPWADLTKRIPKKVQIVGDDLLVTNSNRITLALEKKLCTALLLKVNQIGSLTEAINAAKLSMNNKWNVMVSHRSGETEDSFIADLVTGLGTGQIKSGAPCRSERLAKYNQLMRIEEELGRKAKF